MFHSLPSHSQNTHWLGYGRGDVPPHTQLCPQAQGVGLRARGCSGHRHSRGGRQWGWATGAGMFRYPRGSFYPISRLGYGRGDVPTYSASPTGSHGVGLRARGCSQAERDWAAALPGWATGAGMFRTSPLSRRPAMGLGYGRGDVPLLVQPVYDIHRVGLRARGCS